MSLSFAPSDALVGPIMAELGNIATEQIEGVTSLYLDIPDRAPDDGSVVIPRPSFKVLSDTNAKLYVKLVFPIRYVCRRGLFEDDQAAASQYILPFLLAYNAWANQGLNGNSQSVRATSGGITQMLESGQAIVCLICNVEVLTEFNIPTGV